MRSDAAMAREPEKKGSATTPYFANVIQSLIHPVFLKLGVAVAAWGPDKDGIREDALFYYAIQFQIHPVFWSAVLCL